LTLHHNFKKASMDEPIASGSGSARDLFTAFYVPLREVSRAAKLKSRSEGADGVDVDYLDPETGLAIAWGDALDRR